jgi:hypothetical protein
MRRRFRRPASVDFSTGAYDLPLTTTGEACDSHCMTTLDDQIRATTDAFASEIYTLIRKAALEAVQSVLAASSGPAVSAPKPAAPPPQAAPARRAPPPRAAPKAAPAPAPKPAPAPARAARAPASKAAPPKPAAKRPLGAKRPPAELAALVEKLGAYIKNSPGQGMEAISKALGTNTSDLTLPVKKLLAAKRVRFEGVKRATKYFPV